MLSDPLAGSRNDGISSLMISEIGDGVQDQLGKFTLQRSGVAGDLAGAR